MRGVKYVTYAFVAIIVSTVLVSVWLGRAERSTARRHTDTFVRILSSCSILLTFVFYYNLIKSEDDARVMAEEQETIHDLERRSNSRKELLDLYNRVPNSVLSVVDLNPKHKYEYANKALEEGELATGIMEYSLKGTIFDLWVSEINMFVHRAPSMVSQVSSIIIQAMSPIVRVAWKEYSFQYSPCMRDFIATVYDVINRRVSIDCDETLAYQNLALEVLERTNHIEVNWGAKPPYYVFKEVEYIKDKEKHYF